MFPLVFCNETFVEDQKRLFIVLDAPYYTAGRKYGFNPPIGVGINREALNYATKKRMSICVVLRNKQDRYYQAAAFRLLNFAASRQSYEKHKQAILAIVPLNEKYFTTFIDEPQVSRIVGRAA